jgi:hypothetical protein
MTCLRLRWFACGLDGSLMARFWLGWLVCGSTTARWRLRRLAPSRNQCRGTHGTSPIRFGPPSWCIFLRACEQSPGGGHPEPDTAGLWWCQSQIMKTYIYGSKQGKNCFVRHARMHAICINLPIAIGWLDRMPFLTMEAIKVLGVVLLSRPEVGVQRRSVLCRIRWQAC